MPQSTNGTAVSTSTANWTAVLPNTSGENFKRELRIRHTGSEDFLLSIEGGSSPAAYEYIDGDELVIVIDFRNQPRAASVYIKRIGATDVTGIHAYAE